VGKLLPNIYDLLEEAEMEFKNLWRSILNNEFNLSRMNFTKLPLKIDLNQLVDFFSMDLTERKNTTIEKNPGSEGEHLLQEKYHTKDRSMRFYHKQVFEKLNENMCEFISQTDLSFISTWGRSGLGANIQLNQDNSYIIDRNKIIIRVNSYHTLRNIETNPNITLYCIDFIDKRVGLHINGKASIITGAEIFKSSQLITPNVYGLPGKNIPLELINKARIDVEGYWVVVTTEECYIHCSKHILAHTEKEKKLVGSGTSELSALELLEENILKAEMFVIATADRHGETDCSLRAGPPGFIEIHEGKIRYPEYRGNGVLASLGNITENPEVALSIFNFCSTSEKTIFIKGIAKILDEDISSSTDNMAKKAIEHWIEIEPIEIQVRQEKSRPLYQKIEGRKVPWGTDDDKTKKTGYFITATDPSAISLRIT
jgi:predicted pyridoxine 5'-phosphate oxidase superfamily flavin-nucleotide-binding protein